MPLLEGKHCADDADAALRRSAGGGCDKPTAGENDKTYFKGPGSLMVLASEQCAK